uniref:PDEase domain-containing protein n=1 Tax=Chromera velia CCMP2878 TaxID=1169474 RepID=A0A0G4I7H8_9ALVE|eukprot:Cvel_1933.t1-p1 / transcript=Cvel_1933.t1 / gene=Cvel_1933 / organism=Chromera_velia_CCMP2878 / gene_product=Calcium/calmodulin-dependent 3',5'-cyclic, putative / transcript_product=Calcium/calmodulin-dependent 3',5'-cyclic, putative / location=Cvel_scaffold73:4698-10961(-) / protein_length=851 / sequence_SO=supercontig / SO=protein_coding / is_pseudo=false
MALLVGSGEAALASELFLIGGGPVAAFLLILAASGGLCTSEKTAFVGGFVFCFAAEIGARLVFPSRLGHEGAAGGGFVGPSAALILTSFQEGAADKCSADGYAGVARTSNLSGLERSASMETSVPQQTKGLVRLLSQLSASPAGAETSHLVGQIENQVDILARRESSVQMRRSSQICVPSQRHQQNWLRWGMEAVETEEEVGKEQQRMTEEMRDFISRWRAGGEPQRDYRQRSRRTSRSRTRSRLPGPERLRLQKSLTKDFDDVKSVLRGSQTAAVLSPSSVLSPNVRSPKASCASSPVPSYMQARARRKGTGAKGFTAYREWVKSRKAKSPDNTEEDDSDTSPEKQKSLDRMLTEKDRDNTEFCLNPKMISSPLQIRRRDKKRTEKCFSIEAVEHSPDDEEIKIRTGFTEAMMLEELALVLSLPVEELVGTPLLDVFDLDSCSGGKPLACVATAADAKYRFTSRLSIEEKAFFKFAAAVESGYRKEPEIPFHNSMHAAEVANCMAGLLDDSGASEKAPALDLFACFVAAMGHDIVHPGKNNAWQINTQSRLAVRYNDQSVLEHFHASALWEVLSAHKGIYSGLRKDEIRRLRHILCSLILATDLKFTFDFLRRLESHAKRDLSRKNSQAWVGLEEPQAAGEGEGDKEKTRTGLPPKFWTTHSETREALLTGFMKVSDLSHTVKPFELHFEWSIRVYEEFHAQGDAERKAGLPISLLCGRTKFVLEKDQLGFLNFLVFPILSAIGDVLQNSEFDEEYKEKVQDNITVWEAMKRAREKDEARLKRIEAKAARGDGPGSGGGTVKAEAEEEEDDEDEVEEERAALHWDLDTQDPLRGLTRKKTARSTAKSPLG